MIELILSEGIDANRTSASKASVICYYQYFLDKNLSVHQLPVTAIMIY